MKEKIKYIDDTEVEVDIYQLGCRKVDQLADAHLPMKELTFGKDDSMTIKGDINMFGLSTACVETIKGIDINKISKAEVVRIYKKYFEKDIMVSLGKGGNPN